MNVRELTIHRRQLFEVIDRKVGEIYFYTRNRRYIEEVRWYVIVILGLMRDYFIAHEDHFLVKREYAQMHDGISPFINWTEANRLKFCLHEDEISSKDINSVRWHIWWIFWKILEIHSLLEKLDSKDAVERRYVYHRWSALLLPRKNWKGRKGWSRSWDNTIWSKLEKWSWKFRASHDYQCYMCSETIYSWEIYDKEVIRMGDAVEIIRSHENCPEDPNDPRRREEEEINWWELGQEYREAA